MFRLRSSRRLAGGRFVFDPSLSIVLTLALLLAGCGGRGSHAPTADARVATPPQSQFRSALAVPASELEADGLPMQRPPLIERTRIPVDPSEPFSPDYGSSPVSGKSAKVDWLSPVSSQTLAIGAIESEHAVVMGDGVREYSARAAVGPVPSYVSIRDLPDDLPPDFRERLIVMNELR